MLAFSEEAVASGSVGHRLEPRELVGGRLLLRMRRTWLQPPGRDYSGMDSGSCLRIRCLPAQPA